MAIRIFYIICTDYQFYFPIHRVADISVFVRIFLVYAAIQREFSMNGTTGFFNIVPIVSNGQVNLSITILCKGICTCFDAAVH